MHRALAAGVALAVASTGVSGAELPGSLASPMIDPTIFRQDQVQRLSGRFGDWTVVCDEVKALKRRYCSLRSSVGRDSLGRGIYVDVSTGDDGRPAVLLHLPLGISLGAGVRIAVSRPRSERVKAGKKPAADIAVALCSPTECLAVWNPGSRQISELNGGAALTISFCTLRPGFSAFRPRLSGSECESRSDVAISGAGFKAAVLASLK